MSLKGNRSWLAEQPTINLLCRDTRYHHSWHPSTVERDGTGWIEYMLCERCGAVKKSRLTKHGYIEKQSIVYEKGYLRVGLGRATRADNAEIRATHLNRRTER